MKVVRAEAFRFFVDDGQFSEPLCWLEAALCGGRLESDVPSKHERRQSS